MVCIYYGRMTDCRWVSYSLLTYDPQRLSQSPWWGLNLVSWWAYRVCHTEPISQSAWWLWLRPQKIYKLIKFLFNRSCQIRQAWNIKFMDSLIDKMWMITSSLREDLKKSRLMSNFTATVTHWVFNLRLKLSNFALSFRSLIWTCLVGGYSICCIHIRIHNETSFRFTEKSKSIDLRIWVVCYMVRRWWVAR